MDEEEKIIHRFIKKNEEKEIQTYIIVFAD